MDADRADVSVAPNAQHPPIRLSVVIPTYHRNDMLVHAVGSALADAPPGVEIIIVDDGSTPHRAPSAEDYPDPRVRVLRRSANGGVAAAQNTGLFAANAPFVCFLHSDDRYLPGGLKQLLEALENAPMAWAVEAATERHIAGITTAAPAAGVTSVVPPQLEGVEFRQFAARTVRNLHLAGWIFRTDQLRSLGGFDERLRAYEDFELLLRLFENDVEFDSTVVAHIDATGHDRLGLSPHMQDAQAELLEMYQARLIRDFGSLPDGWRDWAVMASVRALQAEQPAAARRHLRRSLVGRWKELPKRLPLLVATTLPQQWSKRFGQRVERSYSRRSAATDQMT